MNECSPADAILPEWQEAEQILEELKLLKVFSENANTGQELGKWQGWMYLSFFFFLILVKSEKWEYLKGLLKFSATILTSVSPVSTQHNFTLEWIIFRMLSKWEWDARDH